MAVIPSMRPMSRLDDQVCQDVSTIGTNASRMPIGDRLAYLEGVLNWIITWRNKAEEDFNRGLPNRRK